MGVPYGSVVVAKLNTSTSTDTSTITLYSTTEETDFLLFGDVVGGTGWSLTINWTDPENNARSVSSSNGAIPVQRIRTKSGTNVTYSITGGSSTTNGFATLLKT